MGEGKDRPRICKDRGGWGEAKFEHIGCLVNALPIRLTSNFGKFKQAHTVEREKVQKVSLSGTSPLIRELGETCHPTHVSPFDAHSNYQLEIGQKGLIFVNRIMQYQPIKYSCPETGVKTRRGNESKY